MTSKVLVKLPGGPFAQVSAVKKSGSEVSVGASCGLSGVGFGGGAGNSVEAALRVSQLEQNLRFLQEQHQLMLAGLHREIDTLRQRNRDLQFQIIFAKESVSTSPAKADEESPKVKSVADKDTPRVQVAEKSEVVHSKPETQKPKAEGTREKEAPVKKQTEPDDPSQDERYAQLQREVESERARCRALEQELVTARTALEASQSQTTALQALLQHHKVVSGGSVSVVEAGAGAGRLQRRLEEAERLVVRLRAEASSQRREVRPSSHHQHHHAGVTNLLFEPAHAAAPVARNYLQSIKASLSAGGRSAVGGAGASGGGGGRGRQQQQQRFPPLQQTNSQTPPHYWQQTQQLDRNVVKKGVSERVVSKVSSPSHAHNKPHIAFGSSVSPGSKKRNT